MIPLVVAATLLAASPYCKETPSKEPSRSEGRASRGSLHGGVRLEDGDDVRVLPLRHRERCLSFGVARLVDALRTAGARVRREHEGSPPLGVGNLSRAQGGPIPPYSRSHQAGRDVDLAFFQRDERGSPVAAQDLTRFSPEGRGPGGRTFDDERNFALVRALLEDRSISLRWIFVSEGLTQRLLREGRRQKAPNSLLERAAEVLHQPSDAPPHDDHFHLRIRCTPEERRRGCVD